MKLPYEKTVIKELLCWECGLGHNHISELIALKCQKRQLNKLKYHHQSVTKEQMQERNIRLLKRYIEEENFAKVAKDFNLSGGWVRSIVYRFIRFSCWRAIGRTLPPFFTDELADKLLETKVGRERNDDIY